MNLGLFRRNRQRSAGRCCRQPIRQPFVHRFIDGFSRVAWSGRAKHVVRIQAMMFVHKTNSLVQQVLRNCSISDSRHCGLYTVCGLALRLRDLYKWEKGLEPWVEHDSSKILAWIADKEEQWERLGEDDFVQIEFLDAQFDPFNVEEINALLEPEGLIYGAGYVEGLKPTFFLAVLEEKREVDGYPVHILGRELARDLLTVPALSQERSIFIRRESARLFLWNQMFFVRKSGRGPLKVALEQYGLKWHESKDLQRSLSTISAQETETYIRHELGEMQDTVFDRHIWREIVSTFPHTSVEFLARTVKDLLADTSQCGTLQYIVKEHRVASMALYVAFLDGLRKALFPELIEAFKDFEHSRDWGIMGDAVASGYNTARYYAEEMIHIFKSGKQSGNMAWAEDEIKKSLIAPLNR